MQSAIDQIVDLFYQDEKPSAEERDVIDKALDGILKKFGESLTLVPAAVPGATPVRSTKSDGTAKKTPGPKKGSVSTYNIWMGEKKDEWLKTHPGKNYRDFQAAMKTVWAVEKENAQTKALLEERLVTFSQWKESHPGADYKKFMAEVEPLEFVAPVVEAEPIVA